MRRLAIHVILACAFAAAAAASARAQPVTNAWSAEREAWASDEARCTARSPFISDVIVTLTLRSSQTRFLNVDLNAPSWRVATGRQVDLTATFSDGTTLKASGRLVGQFVDTALAAPAVRPWLHELTAAAFATLTVTGHPAPGLRLDLRGASVAVDAMQRCAIAAGMRGLPAPFRSVPGAVETQAAPCVAYETPVRLHGRVVMAQAEDANGTRVKFPQLNLAQPLCTVANTGEDAEEGVRQLQIAAVGVPYPQVRALVGHAASISGSLYHANNGHHFTRVLISADAVSKDD